MALEYKSSTALSLLGTLLAVSFNYVHGCLSDIHTQLPCMILPIGITLRRPNRTTKTLTVPETSVHMEEVF